MGSLIREVTKQRLQLIPDSSSNFTADLKRSDCEFDVKVTNASNQFASFQVELITDGTDPNSRIKWYNVEPKICAKKPPGDTTQFHVVITRAPIPSYDTTIPIAIRVFSIESEALFDTKSIELVIKKPESPLRVYLPIKDLKVYPGDRLDIPVLVYNLSPKFTRVDLSLNELDPAWFSQQETTKTIQVDAGSSHEMTFCCSPPKQTQTESRIYEFFVKAEDQNQNSTSFEGRVEVLPYGVVEFQCLEPYQIVPQSETLLKTLSNDPASSQTKNGMAEYQFQFVNLSNLKQRILLEVLEAGEPTNLDALPALEVEPGASTTTTHRIRKSRWWIGWNRQFRFEATPKLVNANSGEPSDPVYADPNLQTLDLEVRPLIPLWLQLLIAALGLLGLGLLWWLTPPRSPHQAPVNSVRIMDYETTVLSGSSDRTVRRWDVNPISWIVNQRRLSYRGIVASAENTQRAVRVIREMPEREGQIAVGLESGEIQLWQVSSAEEQPFETIYDQNDRVFDLDFTPDSRYLFSGHGSGNVRRWSLHTNQNSPVQQYDFRGAVSALSVIDLGFDRTLVAIGGQYNKFVLWDWARSLVYEVNYGWKHLNPQESQKDSIPPVMGKYDYINTLSVAANVPLMAMADNQGYITLWDISGLLQCTSQTGDFKQGDEFGSNYGNSAQALKCDVAQLEQWQAGREGQSVRAVALSNDGCYLASVGDDGQVILWLLGDPERRSPTSPDAPNSILLASFPGTPLRAVDIKHPAADYVLVAANAPENQVRLYRQSVDPSSCPATTKATK